MRPQAASLHRKIKKSDRGYKGSPREPKAGWSFDRTVGFAALNAYCFYTLATAGFIQAALANAATVGVFIDLLIALTMVALWMVRDAAQRGATVVPYLLLTLFLGSMGPLL
jgi:hypothetical protein